MKICCLRLAVLWMAACCCQAQTRIAAPLGLSTENKTLMHDGKPYRGMEINYVQCFWE
jgi:hypothetical protein